MEKKLTIFTPTYNRKYIISRLYESLCNQTNMNFIWLIVDDGSNDNTKELIDTWKKEKKITINYVIQSNAGKHIAHNTAITMCNTPMFTCVDSDDYLTKNAVEVIYENYQKIINDKDIAGILFPRGKDEETPINKYLPPKLEKASIKELYDKYNYKGDTFLIFKTNILNKYLFPQFEGEKFVTEAVIYDLISQKYKMLLKNDILYIGEYLEDGYSRNIDKVHRNNPKGYLYYLEQRIEKANNFKERYNAIAYYILESPKIRETKHLMGKDLKYDIKIYGAFIVLTFPKVLYIKLKRFLNVLLRRG